MRIGIIGGGIAGLAAAWELHRASAGLAQAQTSNTQTTNAQILQKQVLHVRIPEIFLLEASGRTGGKLLTTEFGGHLLDEGADAFITRVPYGKELCEQLGLETTSPATSRAFIWHDNSLKALPKKQILGVPLDLDGLRQSGLVSELGITMAEADLGRAGQPAKIPPSATIGSLVRSRLGDEIAENLVFPLVGSINAGDCDFLDLNASAPLLAEAAATDASLIAGLQSITQNAAAREPAHPHPDESAPPLRTATANPGPRPVFLAPKAGMGAIADKLTSLLAANIHLNCPAHSIEPADLTTTGNFSLKIASPLSSNTFLSSNTLLPVNTPLSSNTLTADAVILATPAYVAADLLENSFPQASRLLREIEYASVALVSLAFEAQDVPLDLNGSGFLVPATSGLNITACSWASSKWSRLRGGNNQGEGQGKKQRNKQDDRSRNKQGDSHVLLRVSVGRARNPATLAQVTEPTTQLAAIQAAQTQLPLADDNSIIEAVLSDLKITMGITATPSSVRISRWERSFPQYTKGHLARINQLEEMLNPEGIFLAGALLRGVGVPACIASGQIAAKAALQHIQATTRQTRL